MNKSLGEKKSIIVRLLLILMISNFSFSFAYWASIENDQSISDSTVQIGAWNFEDTAYVVATFRSDYAAVLALTTETVTVSDKAAVEAALAAYGVLSEDAKAELTVEEVLLVDLLAEIIAFENSVFLDFEGYAYDSGLTGTVDIDGRIWYGSGIYISNDPNYDVWVDTRSLALKAGAYFESVDLFINGIDKITLYSGALNFDNGTSFAYKVQYELESNPGVWLTVQEGGSDLIIEVISGTPLTYAEINVNITEAVNIRFTPVIGNTSDYINLDNIRIYEHVVSGALEATTFRTVYADALALSVGTIEISDKTAVQSALSAYDLLSVDAQAELTLEKALLDSLFAEVEKQEDLAAATAAVITAEGNKTQTNVDTAQILVTALPSSTEKTALQDRLDAVQNIIDAVTTFIVNHASVLTLTIETVLTSDKAAVESALADYALLSQTTKAELTAEKALLDSLLVEINSQTPTATLVAEFRVNHAGVLALTVGTVQISDKVAVELALEAYDLLTIDAKVELTAEKALLDSLFVEIIEQEATTAVVIAEGSNLQADVDVAQVLIAVLVDGTVKSSLQARLDAVQVIVNTQAAASVDNLITILPSTGEIALSDQVQIEAARTAYEALTPIQKVLVAYESLLTLAEAELAALQIATTAVVIAEGSNLQAHVDTAQALVTALTNGTSKTVLQNRLNSVQDIIDVELARTIIINYFAANPVVVSKLNNNSVKQTAFITKANEIVTGLDVTISITNSVYVDRTHSTYTVQIVKNGAQVTIDVDVVFTR